MRIYAEILRRLTARLRALAVLRIAEIGREMDALVYILTVLCESSAAQDAPSAA